MDVRSGEVHGRLRAFGCCLTVVAMMVIMTMRVRMAVRVMMSVAMMMVMVVMSGCFGDGVRMGVFPSRMSMADARREERCDGDECRRRQGNDQLRPRLNRHRY